MGTFSNKLGKRKPTRPTVDSVDEQVRHAIGSLLRRPDGRLALRLVDAITEQLDLAGELAPEASRWACASGCNFCCHMPVMATAPELARLARAVLAHPDASGLRERIERNADIVAELDEDQLFDSRLPCALLDADGRCSVYAARPLACRGHVSFSREVCEAAHVDPAAELVFDGDPVMQQARTDADTRLATSLISAKLDSLGYELHDGLVRALELELESTDWLDPDAFTESRTVDARLSFDAELRQLIAEIDD